MSEQNFIQDLPDPTAPPIPNQNPIPKKKHTKILIAILAVIIVVGIIAYLWGTNFNTVPTTASTASTPVSSSVATSTINQTNAASPGTNIAPPALPS
jgi:flagellar basal body-associated protein FliL